MRFEYKTRGTCSSKILFDVDDGIVHNLEYIGGCNGNLQGISHLVIGMKAQDAIDRMRGIRCGGKPSSCPDQLAAALTQALEQAAQQGA